MKTARFSGLQKLSPSYVKGATTDQNHSQLSMTKLSKAEIIEAIGFLSGKLAVFLLAGWLMMLVLGWLGVVGIGYGKALVIVILIDFLKTSQKS